MADNEETYITRYGEEIGKGWSQTKTGKKELDDHFQEIYDMAALLDESHKRPNEPYIDKTTEAAFDPVFYTGGSRDDAGNWAEDGTENVHGLGLREPEKAGKWEWWGIETAAGLRQLFTHSKYKLPEYNTDDLLVVGAGRGVTGFFLGDTGLSNNNGIFKNVTMVEEDADLVKYSNSLITKADITNVKSVQNRSIEEPSPRTDGYDEIVSKQYDVIIATLPFSNQQKGIYYVNQQVRTLGGEIENGNGFPGGSWPIGDSSGNSDFYTDIKKFEDKCYDENFNRHSVLFTKANKLLKPNGLLVSVHHTHASDIDTFSEMISQGNLSLEYHTMIDKGMGARSIARHFFLRRVLISSANPMLWVMVCRKK